MFASRNLLNITVFFSRTLWSGNYNRRCYKTSQVTVYINSNQKATNQPKVSTPLPQMGEKSMSCLYLSNSVTVLLTYLGSPCCTSHLWSWCCQLKWKNAIEWGGFDLKSTWPQVIVVDAMNTMTKTHTHTHTQCYLLNVRNSWSLYDIVAIVVPV